MFVSPLIFSFVWYKSVIQHMVTLVLFMFDNHLESREKEPKQVLVWYTHCFVYIWLGPSHRGVWWPTGTKFNNKQRPKHYKHWNSNVMISKKVGGKTYNLASKKGWDTGCNHLQTHCLLTAVLRSVPESFIKSCVSHSNESHPILACEWGYPIMRLPPVPNEPVCLWKVPNRYFWSIPQFSQPFVATELVWSSVFLPSTSK